LRAVFGGLHLYPSGEGEIITVATAGPAPEPETLKGRAAAMQEKFRFRFALPELAARRTERENATQKGELLTDDFAPVNLYDTIGEKKRKK
jgi:hypothetical protein